ncbi:conserved hypothetical protein, membrane [Beggiatoa sp. PS]|nr:conserved hypothetical protein, membrane [Beggiatoa sp. PS]
MKAKSGKKIITLAYLFLIILGIVALSTLGILGIETAGRNIPQQDLIADYFTALAWAIALALSILFWPVPTRHKRVLSIVWLAKIFVTLGVMLFYEYNYGLDAYNYFYSAKTGDFAWQDFEFGVGTPNMINLARLHQYFIADSYHALKVTSAMVGMIAIYIFYRAAVLFLKREEIQIFYVLALYPTILFWSSILGKDPIMLIGVALYVYGVVGWENSGKLQYLLWGALGVWIASFIRLWYAPILLAPLAVFFVLGKRNFFVKIAFIGIIITAFLFSFSLFAERFSIETTQDVVSTTGTISENFSTGGSGQEIEGGFSGISSMLLFAPLGIFTAFFRPLLAEVLNPFGMIAGLENSVLLFFFILAIKRTKLKELKEPLIAWAIALVIIWGIVYGPVSYGNLGTAVRYKLQVLPILLGLSLYLSRIR